MSLQREKDSVSLCFYPSLEALIMANVLVLKSSINGETS